MDRHDLIKAYCENKKVENEKHREKLAEQHLKEKETEADVSAFLMSKGLRLSSCNGYVYCFDYDGLRYTLCDQTDRTVGEAHLIPENKVDEEFLQRDASWAFHGHGNHELKQAFNYKRICINMPIQQAIREIVREVAQ
jgi:hypothetical protein